MALRAARRALAWCECVRAAILAKVREERAQGTTEYAILVGVLVSEG